MRTVSCCLTHFSWFSFIQFLFLLLVRFLNLTVNKNVKNSFSFFFSPLAFDLVFCFLLLEFLFVPWLIFIHSLDDSFTYIHSNSHTTHIALIWISFYDNIFICSCCLEIPFSHPLLTLFFLTFFKFYFGALLIINVHILVLYVCLTAISLGICLFFVKSSLTVEFYGFNGFFWWNFV